MLAQAAARHRVKVFCLFVCFSLLCHRLEVTLEKKVEGLTWRNVLKAGTDVTSQSVGVEDALSSEELEKAKKLLAELAGKEELEELVSNPLCMHVSCMYMYMTCLLHATLT